MVEYRFSVWTPTYNRAELLKRVYRSLLNQTFKNFEWIIIDDGSNDNTEKAVQQFIKDGLLKKIRYFKKENGGKHTAWRLATEKFTAKYVVTIDSDDTLTPYALELFDKHWTDLENSDYYENFWEVKGRVQNELEKLVGDSLPTNVFDATTQDVTFKYKIKGEMQACRKTAVLRAEAKVPDYFLFQEKCSNLSEIVRWMRAGKIYKSRFFEKIVRTYYSDAETTFSQSNRNSDSNKGRYNHLVATIYMLGEHKNYILKWNISAYIELIITLLYTSFALKLNPFKVSPHNLTFVDKVIMLVSYFPIYFLYLIRK